MAGVLAWIVIQKGNYENMKLGKFFIKDFEKLIV
jgi:hypothetical protein